MYKKPATNSGFARCGVSAKFKQHCVLAEYSEKYKQYAFRVPHLAKPRER